MEEKLQIRARFITVKAIMTVRFLNLVAPLAPKQEKRATDTRIQETTGLIASGNGPRRSRAVASLIGSRLRQCDVNSATRRSTPPTTRTCRTLAMATRTTTTRTTETVPASSADPSPQCHADFLFPDLVQAYYDCRTHKRNTASALAFEVSLERNLTDLFEELKGRTYHPGKSICFVVTRPKPREVWAADFRDRIVHHLLYNHIAARFENRFIADSCACIVGRGTLYAAQRLESKVRSITRNWSRPAHYLKCDVANFFVNIDKRILWRQLERKINEPQWRWLAELVLFHDPRENFEWRGNPQNIEKVPAHKRLTSQDSHHGLPIGNLSSQFFANVYLDALDQFAKHQLRSRHYIRYVDDFVLLHESPQWLNNAYAQIREFLPQRLGIELNPRKTILQPIERGIDFVGQVILPWRRITRRKTFHQALLRIEQTHPDDLFKAANSYYGLLRQASHSETDRMQLTKAILRRGRCVNFAMTKIV